MWVITGTNGSIGGHLTSFYLSKNLEVLAVSASPDDVKKNISKSGISYDERNLHTYYDDYSKDLNDDKMKNILGQKKISCLVISSGEYFSGSFYRLAMKIIYQTLELILNPVLDIYLSLINLWIIILILL